jgi:hypothetical protein
MKLLKIILLLFCVTISGCAVVKTVKTEMTKEITGFKEDWERTFGKERIN